MFGRRAHIKFPTVSKLCCTFYVIQNGHEKILKPIFFRINFVFSFFFQINYPSEFCFHILCRHFFLYNLIHFYANIQHSHSINFKCNSIISIPIFKLQTWFQHAILNFALTIDPIN